MNALNKRLKFIRSQKRLTLRNNLRRNQDRKILPISRMSRETSQLLNKFLIRIIFKILTHWTQRLGK